MDVMQSAAVGGSSQDEQFWEQQEVKGEAAPSPTSFFELTAHDAGGENLISFEQYRGSVCLVVNVASL